MQDCAMSKFDSIVLCDANSQGFPMRYVSDGFNDLFGYSSQECLGKRCGAFIGCVAVATDDSLIHRVGEAAELEASDVQSRLAFLKDYASKEMQCMASDPENREGFAVLVNKKKDGSIFTCELLTRTLKHPARGWSYCVGYQRDVTGEVPIAQLLRAASEEGLYNELIQRRQAMRSSTLAKMASTGSTAFLNGRAEEMWVNLMNAHQPQMAKEAKKSGDQRSMISMSTTASGISRISTISGKSSASSWDAAPPLVAGLEAGSVQTTQPVATHPLLMYMGTGLQDLPQQSAAAKHERGFLHARPRQGSRARDLLDILEGVVEGQRDEEDSELSTGVLDEEEEERLAVPDTEGAHLLHDDDEPRQELALADSSCEADDQLASEAETRSTSDASSQPEDALASDQSPESLQVVEDLDCMELHDLYFSLCVIDPSQPGCPIVACSGGFQDFLERSKSEVLGKELGFLSEGVPPSACADAQAQAALKNYLDNARRGDFQPGQSFVPKELACEEKLPLVDGEFAYTQACSSKSGKVTNLLHFMKLVELEDLPFVVVLLEEVPEASLAEPRGAQVWDGLTTDHGLGQIMSRISENLEVVEQILGGLFWYSAPMRRQAACDSSDWGDSSL